MEKQPLVKIGEGLPHQIGEITQLSVKGPDDGEGDEAYAMKHPQKFELDVPEGTRHIWFSSVTEFPDEMKITESFIQDGKFHLHVANWSYCFDINVAFYEIAFSSGECVTIHKAKGVSGFPILVDEFSGEVPTGKDLSISHEVKNGFNQVWIQPVSSDSLERELKVTHLDTYNITVSGSNNNPPFKLVMRFFVC